MFENEEITEPVEGEFDEDLDQDLPPPQFDPTKRIMAFNLTEHESVELMAKLRFDRIYARNHFFKAIVTAYLREDPIIRSFIDYLKKEQFDVKNRIFQKQKKVLSKIVFCAGSGIVPKAE